MCVFVCLCVCVQMAQCGGELATVVPRTTTLIPRNIMRKRSHEATNAPFFRIVQNRYISSRDQLTMIEHERQVIDCHDGGVWTTHVWPIVDMHSGVLLQIRSVTGDVIALRTSHCHVACLTSMSSHVRHQMCLWYANT